MHVIIIYSTCITVVSTSYSLWHI